jgi:hypothetical protein
MVKEFDGIDANRAYRDNAGNPAKEMNGIWRQENRADLNHRLTESNLSSCAQ